MNPDLLLQIQPQTKSDFDAFKHKKESHESYNKNADQTNTYKTSKSKTENTHKSKDTAENNQNFSDVMSRLRQNRSDGVQKEQDLATLHFHREAKTTLDTTEGGQDTLSPEQILSANITALNVEIAKLLEDIRENGDYPQDSLIAQAAEKQEGDNEGVMKLLSFMLNNLETNAADEQQSDSQSIIGLLQEIKTLLGDNEEQLIAAGLKVEDLATLQKNLQKLIEEESNYASLHLLNTMQNKLLAYNKDNDTGDKAKQPILFTSEHLKAERYELRYQLAALTGNTEGLSEEGYDFKSLLKGAQGQDLLGNSKIAEIITQTQGGAAPLPSWMVWSGDAPLALSELSDLSLILNQSGLGAANPAHSLQASLTALATQAPAAGQPHPATQTVMATIQKAIKAGDNTNIKIQLDPPELGRVEVKMSIGQDSATKIVLTAEKPETYMMLQRDSQVLERALQEAGIESDSSLSFELAQQDHDFGQDNRRGGGHDQGGKGAGSDANAEEIIESTMTWHVDPETGHMHYNILV